jgi:hypothetical protein
VRDVVRIRLAKATHKHEQQVVNVLHKHQNLSSWYKIKYGVMITDKGMHRMMLTDEHVMVYNTSDWLVGTGVTCVLATHSCGKQSQYTCSSL